MDKNHNQRQRIGAAFASMIPGSRGPRKDPGIRGSRSLFFGGNSFFPTESPRPLMAIHKCIGDRLPSRLAKKIAQEVRTAIFKGEKDIKAPTCFKIKPVWALIRVKVGENWHNKKTAVGIHRGTHVNTRHNTETFIRPRDARRAALKAGGAA